MLLETTKNTVNYMDFLISKITAEKQLFITVESC